MKVTKTKDRMIIEHRDQQISFIGLRYRKDNNLSDYVEANGKKVARENILFMELQRVWDYLNPEEQDDLFMAYLMLDELSNEDIVTQKKHMPKIIQTIAKFHKAEVYRKLYPIERLWVPQNMEDTHDDMNSNYPEAMTYIRPDYYELLILALMVKPYIPVFLTMGTFPVGKNLPIDTQRKMVDNLTYCLELLRDTEIMSLPGIPKLEGFLQSVMEKVEKEQSNKGMNNTSLSVLAAMRGYGTDMMEEYILAFALIRLLSIRDIGGELPRETMTSNNVVTGMYFLVKQEIETGFATKISNQPVLLKLHPESVVFNGEKGKINSMDLVQARSTAPMKEFVRTEVSFLNYRRFLKTMNLPNAAPADAKILIDSMLETHKGPIYVLHEWLVALALHRSAHYRTYSECGPEAFMYGMALAQITYLNYGMYDIAQLLSCDMVFSEMSIGYAAEPIRPELKTDLDRYYRQEYRNPRNLEPQSTPRESLNLLHKDHIDPYLFHLRATPEAAALLRCETDKERYIPHLSLHNTLSEFMVINARRKLEEVEWFNS
ncbi:hypothetical protein pEaSNUABM29_00131 [Erwinia phage pEa_SNUABM_29]|nr:hypothetical protein pEaSNUABM29_00131 [Erwinia phage pEa_SNUABM_29]